ncbi:hypothetical protein TNCV_1475581 [Trichonephila clavipes]|nr:hypothetical protein TNCV_1475581 [Trichonephila clavipes]
MESVSDSPRSERLATYVSDENIEKVRKLITENGQLTAGMIADELQINCESVRQIGTQKTIHRILLSDVVLYTAGQLLRTDNTIIHSNHKMKGSKMWKIRISAGY